MAQGGAGGWWSWYCQFVRLLVITALAPLACSREEADTAVDSAGEFVCSESHAEAGFRSFTPTADDAEWDSVGCGWAFVTGGIGTGASGEDFRASIEAELPPDDRYGRVAGEYSLEIGSGASFTVLAADPGGAEIEYWTCSDYVSLFTGAEWRARRGTLSVTTSFICEDPPGECDVDTPNPFFLGRFSMSGIELVEVGTGSTREFDPVTVHAVIGPDGRCEG